MIIERGRVVAIDGDALWVETIQKSTCGACSAQKACGQGLMNKWVEGRRNQLRVPLGRFSADEFGLDDQVDIGVPERALLGGALIVYILPLLSLILGMALASRWGPGDGVAAFGALAGFALGFALVRLHALRSRHRPDYQACLLGVVRNVSGVLPFAVADLQHSDQTTPRY